MKILFLHGYAQSGRSFSAKTKATQKAFKNAFGADTIQFNIPDAPHRVNSPDMALGPTTACSAAASLSPGESDENDDVFGWWRWRGGSAEDPSAELVGFGDTLSDLGHVLDTFGPFDGVVGFSQGAACAALLASMLERPGAPHEFGTTHGPFRFVVCCGGFRAPVRYEQWYTPKIRTPVLHIIGSLDTVVGVDRSLQLARCCENGEDRILYHPGGHYVPATKNVVGPLMEFVRACCEEKQVERAISPDPLRGEEG